MTDPRALFGARLRLDKRRQPSRLESLDALVGALEQIRVLGLNPYGLTREERDELFTRVPELKTGCKGNPASMHSGYLYRLQSISSLRALHAKVNERGDLEEHEIQTLRHARADATRGWLPLTDLIHGPLRGQRGITWWTPLELPALDDVRVGALRLGLPLNWLHPRSLILRCRAAALQDVRVPTVLDAFDSPVFLATSETSPIPHGIAIDLTDPNALRGGSEECVLAEVDARHVQFVPVLVPDPSAPGKTAGAGARYHDAQMLFPTSPLWRHLKDHYEQLAGG